MISKRYDHGRLLAVLAAVYGLLAVILGALGSHAIPFGDDQAMRLWDIALQFHMVHALAMLAIAAISMRLRSPKLVYCGLMLALATLMFSGSLYLRAAGINLLPSFITPAGGMLLMAAWAWLAVIFFNSRFCEPDPL